MYNIFNKIIKDKIHSKGVQMKLGEIIRKYRADHGLTLREFAQRCETSHSYISMLEDGKNSKTGQPMTPTFATLKKISAALNLSFTELIDMAEDLPFHIDPDKLNSKNPSFSFPPELIQSSAELFKGTLTPNKLRVPVLGYVAAGIPIEAIQDIIDYEEIPEQLARDGSEYFALQIKGDSMEPKISDGDVVIVRKQPDCDSGQIAIVCVNGDHATCKKIMKQPTGVLLKPLNPSHDPTFYTNEEIESIPITILGRVVELRAKF